MPLHTVLRRVALAALAVATGCASAPGPHRRDYERHLDLPADVAAAIAAGAVRSLLPFADPVPQAAGAPASRMPDGFVIVYERGDRGGWVPRASHRLIVRGTGATSPAGAGPGAGGTIAAAVRAEPLAGNLRLPGWGAAATERLQVHVRGDAGGCSVRADLPAAIAADLAQALDRAFALAVDPAAACVGLAEPNLAGLVSRRALGCVQLLVAAGDPAGAEAQLLRAARLGALTAPQQQQLGEFSAQSGDLALAQERLGDALLQTDDPTLRAHLAGRLRSLATPRTDTAARSRLAPGSPSPAELARAAMRLHTARRQHPDPARDYGLASQLHRQDRDDLAAFACALLAREHTPPSPVLAAGLADPVRRGLDDFVRRVVHGVEPVAAGAVLDPAAAPAR